MRRTIWASVLYFFLFSSFAWFRRFALEDYILGLVAYGLTVLIIPPKKISSNTHLDREEEPKGL